MNFFFFSHYWAKLVSPMIIFMMISLLLLYWKIWKVAQFQLFKIKNECSYIHNIGKRDWKSHQVSFYFPKKLVYNMK